MKRLFDWVLAILTAPMFVGCGSDFDPGSRVVGTRVVAVVVDQPYAHPGETVKVDAQALDTLGRPLEWGFVTCFAPSATTPFACFQKIAEDAMGGTPPALTIGPSNTYSYTVPADALSRLPAAARPSAYVGVLMVTCPGKIQPGNTQGLPLACVADGRALRLDEFEVGVKRVFLREKDRNQNPVIAKVNWDGVEWPEAEVKEVSPCSSATENRYDRCDGGEKHVVAAILGPGARETGTDELGNPFTEDVAIQHYATEGLFEYDARIGERPESGWVARAGASGKTVTLWFVARDNRGGVGWTSRRVKVR